MTATLPAPGPAANGASATDAPERSDLYRRLARDARPYWRLILACFAVSMLATPLALLTPLPLKLVIDSVLNGHPLPGFLRAVVPGAVQHSDTALLILVALLFLVVEVLSQAQSLAAYVLETYTGEKLVLRVRGQLFRHAQRLSLAYHDTRGTADSTYRIQSDAQALQNITVNGVIALATAVITLAGMIWVTAAIDWGLALVALAISPPLLVVSYVYRRRLRRQAREVKQLESGAMSVVQEVLTSIRVVKAFGQEDREQERFVRRSADGMWARIRLAALESGYGILVGGLTALGTGAVVYIGVRHVQSGRITLGDLVLVMGYLAQLYDPLRTISRKAGRLQSYLTSAERVYGLLDEAPDVPEKPHARPLRRAQGRVAFEGVCFGYDAARPVLKDVSFSVEPGASLGLVGATGAGKTTLVSLLTRFYDPTAGRILLDGVDLRDHRLADLRDQFAIVLQESILFSTSIAENIAYGRPDAGRAEIVAAAEAASIHDFIAALPDGYDTMVGERGMRLSGGERQRIALARAFLKDAPILILDEPTSSVDVKTEQAILAAMRRLADGRTTFMIAHRKGTLDRCEATLEIADGRLAGAASP